MKKTIIVFLVLVVLCSSFSPVLAKKNTTTLFESNEITNKKVLYNRAKRGVSDLEESIEPTVSYIRSESGNQSEMAYSIKYNTSQLLKRELVNGEIIEHYATTLIEDVYLPESKTKTINANSKLKPISVRSSLTQDNTDPSISIRAYHTYYYSTGTGSDGYPYFDYWGVRGSWEMLDGQVSFEGGSITARVQGYQSPSGTWKSDSEYRSCASINGTSFNTGFGAYRAILYAYMSSTNSSTLKRGLSTWIWNSIVTVTWNGGSIAGITTN